MKVGRATIQSVIQNPRWAIGYDHAGFELAAKLCDYLSALGDSVSRFGPNNNSDPSDYVPFCIAAAEEVSKGESDFGIVIGGSGQGEQMSANKVRGVRAALCPDTNYALMTRRDNDANVLALGARIVAVTLAIQIIDVWRSTPFEGGRHARRIGHLAEYEAGLLSLPAKLPATQSGKGQIS